MFTLPDLPYAYDALEPTLSAATLRIHHDKHHARYVETVNKIAERTGLKGPTMEDVVRDAARNGDTKLFNNAGQAWNHALFWVSMAPQPVMASDSLARAIEGAFGSHEALKAQFVSEGVNHFGSGWVWLAAQGERLQVLSTHDGDCLLTRPGLKPLLVCDLWEHAYYLDYRNDRAGFLEAWFDRLADWRFASFQFEQPGGWAYPARVGETV